MLHSNEDFKEADFAKVCKDFFPLLLKMFHIQDILIGASLPSMVDFHLPCHLFLQASRNLFPAFRVIVWMPRVCFKPIHLS